MTDPKMRRTEIRLEPMADFFAARVEGYDEHMMKNVDGAAFYYKELAKLIPKKAELSLVDLGCGTGLELEEIFRVNPKVRVTGIDLSMDMLNKLKKKFPEKLDQIKLVNQSYFDYDFRTERFDGAVSVQSLHHFSKDEKLKLYKKLCRGIKKGGFYIEVDYYAPDQKYEDFYFSENKRLRAENRVRNGEFYHYDTPCTISNQAGLFFKAGFSAVKLCYMNGNTGVLLMTK